MRWLRAFLVGAVATAAVLLGLSAAGPASSAPRLSLNIAKCVQTSRQLSVVVLVDQSGSLATTDPQASRVDGLAAALTGLSQLANSSSKPQVEVQLVGFAGTTEASPGAPGWQPVNATTLPRLLKAARAYAAKDTGQATDFGVALGKARSLLATRAADDSRRSAAATPCQAIVWFTDGTYDVVPGSVAQGGSPSSVPYAPGVSVTAANRQAVISAGKRYLCKQSGLMDQLARSGVGVFAIGLSNGVQSGSQNFLQAAATGQGGTYQCGSVLGPATGAYLPASDGQQLFFAFGNLLTGEPGRIRNSVICGTSMCPGGWSRFSTLAGIARFNIRVALPSGLPAGAAGQIEIRGPGGGRASLKPSGPTTAQVDGAAIDATWISPRSIEVVGAFASPAAAPTGKWSYGVFVPGQVNAADGVLSEVVLYSDLAAVVTPPAAGLLRGGTTSVPMHLVSLTPNETPPPSLIARAHPAVLVSDPGRGPAPSASAPSVLASPAFSADITLPAQSSAAQIDTSVVVRFTSASDAPIQPVVAPALSIPTRLPSNLGLPSLSPTSLRMAPLAGYETTSADLTLTPNPDARSCVWFGAAHASAAPPEAGAIQVATSPVALSRSNCIELPADGDSIVVHVTAAAKGEASGRVDAVLDVYAAGKSGEPQTWSVPVTFDMVPSPNVPARAALVVLLVIAGILLPLIFLYILNFLTSRFVKPKQLMLQVLTATIDHGVVAIDDPNRPTATTGFEDPDLASRADLVASADGRVTDRGWDVHGINFRIAYMGRIRRREMPDKAPYGVVSARGRRLVAGSPRRGDAYKGYTEAAVDLSLGGTWIFLPHRTPGAVRAPDPDAVFADTPVGEGAATRMIVSGELVLISSQTADIQDVRTLRENAKAELRDVNWDDVLPGDGPASSKARRRRRKVTPTSAQPSIGGANIADPPEAPAPPSDDDLDY